MREINVGEVICGRYRILDRPLAGGIAEVYQAEDQVTREMVALKRLQRPSEKEEAKRFEREVDTHARLNHPHIVRMLRKESYSIAQNEDATICVLEWVAGGTLESLDDQYNRNMPLRLMLSLMHQVADAVAYGHGQGIVHRDLKPCNVFLDVDLEGELSAKVGDFGTLKLLNSTATKYTVPGSTLGTPWWMAPEQGLGEDFAPTVDVFAIWSIIYGFLTGGRHPYLHNDDPQRAQDFFPLWYRIKNGDLTLAPVSTFNPNVPASLEAMVTRGVDRVPSVRPTASESAVFLKKFWQELGERESTDTCNNLIVLRSDPPGCDPAAETIQKILVAREQRTILGLGPMLPPKIEEAAKVEKSQPVVWPTPVTKVAPVPAKPIKQQVKPAGQRKSKPMPPAQAAGSSKPRIKQSAPSGRIPAARQSVPKVVVAASQAYTAPVAITQKVAVAPAPLPQATPVVVARPAAKPSPSQVRTSTSIKVSKPSSSKWLWVILTLAMLLVGVAVAVWWLPSDWSQLQGKPLPSGMQAAQPTAPATPVPSTAETAPPATAYVPRPPTTRPATRPPAVKGKPRTGSTSDGIVVEGLPPGTPPPLDNP
ncbi:MAG: protein kinase [Patescibacteria group bacterium]|nr:protein kinase [Patescibacteria group bacterium]